MAAALQNQRNLIFASVFPFAAAPHGSTSNSNNPSLSSAPTPHSAAVIASPDATFTTPHHHHSTRSHDRPSSHHHQQNPKHVQRTIAWNTATRFLKLPEWHPGSSSGSSTTRTRKHHHRSNADVEEALRYLLVGEGLGANDAPPASLLMVNDGSAADLLEWYTHEARDHFLACVRPAVLRGRWETTMATPARAWEVLGETVGMLRGALAWYCAHLEEHLLPAVRAVGPRGEERVAGKFRRELWGVVMQVVPQGAFARALGAVLFDAGVRLFGLGGEEGGWGGGEEVDAREVRRRVGELLGGLREVGLGGEQAQRAAAQAMDALMDRFIGSHHMKVDWYGRKPVTRVLRDWVRDGYSPFIKEMLSSLTGDEEVFEANEVQQWSAMAIGRLGRARVENLFDYIVNWDRSLGAILDLKEYITTPAARNHLTNSFLQQCNRRLLHAGATTTHILDTYIYVIRAFIELDSKGILLEKVARPIRRYLRDREDTARIIVSSLLADVEDEAGNPIDLGQDISAEIAAEMLNPVASNVQEEDQELSWGDMNWMPDPVDASPEYRKAKSENVLAYLLSLYDREDFINELKNILGEHLLKNEDSEFEKEIRLLELFKLRLGDNNLQACEVMLKDVLESKRMNKQIHHILKQQSRIYRDSPTELNSQILSSFFWPSLRDDEFNLPDPIQQLMKDYEAGFEGIKDMRKLHWLPALGRVTVALDFSDRSLELDVLPWQAAVIHAFQEADAPLAYDDDDEEEAANEERQRQRRARLRAVGAEAPTPEKKKRKTTPPPPVTKTVAELEELLAMDDAVLRAALTFWVGHRVLTEPSPDTFAVLDSLSDLAADADAEEAAAAAAQEAAEADKAKAVRSAEDVLVENMQVYRQFVLGMLTNQGRMDAGRVCGMLKVALMGGFPFGVEEVGVLLGRMVEEGVLMAVGEGFAVKK